MDTDQPTPPSTTLPVQGGKYTFIVQAGHVYIHLHGEPWVEVEQGGKAIIALLGEYEQLLVAATTQAEKYRGMLNRCAMQGLPLATPPVEDWQPKIMQWGAYPAGTRARSTSGTWVKLEGGQWQAEGGDTFPTPAGDATHVLYPSGTQPWMDGVDEYELGRLYGGRARFDRCKEDIHRALGGGPDTIPLWELLVEQVRRLAQGQLGVEAAVDNAGQLMEAPQVVADRSQRDRALREWFQTMGSAHLRGDVLRRLLPRVLMEGASTIIVDDVVVKDRDGNWAEPVPKYLELVGRLHGIELAASDLGVSGADLIDAEDNEAAGRELVARIVARARADVQRGPWWVAATSPMGTAPSWAVGMGDSEVLHTTDREVAMRVKLLLNGDTPHPSDVGYERAYEQQVLRACEALGYGRVMQVVEGAWAEADPVGALTAGPARGTLARMGFRTCMDLVDAWEATSGRPVDVATHQPRGEPWPVKPDADSMTPERQKWMRAVLEDQERHDPGVEWHEWLGSALAALDEALVDAAGWRGAVEAALGVEDDPVNHDQGWAHRTVLGVRELGNGAAPEAVQLLLAQVQAQATASQHVVLRRREVAVLEQDAQRWATVRGEVLRLDALARSSADGVTMANDDVESLVLGALRQVAQQPPEADTRQHHEAALLGAIEALGLAQVQRLLDEQREARCGGQAGTILEVQRAVAHVQDDHERRVGEEPTEDVQLRVRPDPERRYHARRYDMQRNDADGPGAWGVWDSSTSDWVRVPGDTPQLGAWGRALVRLDSLEAAQRYADGLAGL